MSNKFTDTCICIWQYYITATSQTIRQHARFGMKYEYVIGNAQYTDNKILNTPSSSGVLHLTVTLLVYCTLSRTYLEQRAVAAGSRAFLEGKRVRPDTHLSGEVQTAGLVHRPGA